VRSTRHILPAAVLAIAATVSVARGEATTQAGVIHRAATAPSAVTTAPDHGGFDASRVLWSLAAVLGLIVILRWGGKRLAASGATGRQARAIRVLGRSYLSSKHQMLIVQVGRRVLVLGESGQQLTTLSEITDADEIAALIGQLRGSESRVFEAVPAAPVAPPEELNDPDISAARREVNVLLEKIRVVAKHVKGASA
jgi:flagellar biogenesis protein FliO